MHETRFPAMGSALTHHRLAVALKALVISITVLALYFQDFSIIFAGALVTESTFHILAIPFLFVFLLYRKRKMVNATLLTPEGSKNFFQKYCSLIVGTTLSAVAILTYWYGSYSFMPLEFHMATLPFLTAGLILILFNPQTLKHLFFPIAFLIFLTPPPSELLFGVGSALANLSAGASNGLTNLLGVQATLSADNAGPIITILRPDSTLIPFNVGVACSGIYSLIGFAIFAIFIAYLTAGKFRNKLFIFVIGIPFMLLLNIIRITVILLIGYNYGEALALEIFHSMGATVLMFIGTLILLGINEKIIKKPAPLARCSVCTPMPNGLSVPFCNACGKLFKYPKIKLSRLDIAKIMGIFIAVIMLLSIQAPTFALTQGPAELLYQAPQGIQVSDQNGVLPELEGYTLHYSYRDVAYERVSGNDAAIVYTYHPDDDSKNTIWVAMQIGTSLMTQHRWETCLINFPLSQGDPAKVTQFALHDVQLYDNPPMTGRFFVFQYNNAIQSQAVLYWYQTAVFNINGTSQSKSVMISLITYMDNVVTFDDIENQHISIAKAINSYWQPLKSWSSVTLVISQNGFVLSLGVVVILVLFVLYVIFLDGKEKRSLLTFYRKLSVQDQLLIKALSNACMSSSTDVVTAEFQKLSTLPVTEPYVIQKLNEAKANGLIVESIKNLHDTPVLVWKIQLPKATTFFQKLYHR
ncbi:MAG: exosortase/archaeosortase family protein [Nitrososphaerota archaeon]|jgi:exosortase|nr:exosortase/archaeosortase family protein [Nitrososphaerota archaeon]